MKNMSKTGILLLISCVFLVSLVGCSGGGPLPDGEYEGPGVAIETGNALSIFLPENFTVNGNKLKIAINGRRAGSNEEFSKIVVEYTYKVIDKELVLTNSSGDTYGVFSFEGKDNRAVIIGGEEYHRK